MAEAKAGAGYRVAVVGASGSAGAQIVDALARSSLPVAEWRLFGGPTGRAPRIEVGSESWRVAPLPEGGAARAARDGVDLCVLAATPELARALGPSLAEDGVGIIDVGGALLGQGASGVGYAGGLDTERFEATRILSTPAAAGVLLAAVLAPLAGLGLRQARGAVLESASTLGRAGTEELSGQVVGLFNHTDPPRRLFPEGLAFDLIAGRGPRSEGWAESEKRLAVELAAVLRRAPSDFGISRVLVPAFTGVAASLHVQLDADAKTVAALLGKLPTVSVGDPVSGLREVVGQATAAVGRLRDDPSGDGVHLWATADNLRFGAAANVVALAVQLWRAGLL